MGIAVRIFSTFPLIAILGLIAGWVANGASVPWDNGWRVGLPLLALLPLWADVLVQMRAVEDGRRSWRNYPVTCYISMAAVVFAWSLGFVNPSKVLSKPRLAGTLPSDCISNVLISENVSMDIAQFNVRYDVTASFLPSLTISTSYSECWECSPRAVFRRPMPATTDNITAAFYVPTQHYINTLRVQLTHETDHTLPGFSVDIKDVIAGDQGIYELVISGAFYGDTAKITAEVVTIENPWFAEAPFIVVVCAMMVAQAIYSMGNTMAVYVLDEEATMVEAFKLAARRLLRQEEEEDGRRDSLIVESEPDPVRSKRILALDVLRGISLVVMNCANYGGMGYWFLDHSKWDGLTIADLVFPWFIWIMGVAMAVTLEGARIKDNRTAALLHILRRSAVLCLVGVLLGTYAEKSFALTRIPGVLQRFGLSYLTVSLIILYVPKQCGSCAHDTETYQNVQESSFHIAEPLSFKEFAAKWVRPSFAELPAFLLLVGGWIGVSLGASFSRAGMDCAGYLGPGGISQHGAHFECTGGIANYIDAKIFSGHTWHGCFPCATYMQYDLPMGTCKAMPHHDPEGLLGSLNSISLCWLGLVAGRIVVSCRQKTENRKHVFSSLALLGFTLCLLAAVLCGFRQFGGPIPVNKNLWSTSFIFLMAGTGSILLLVLLYLIDYKKLWAGKPFLFVGMNSILYYCTHEV